jgi:polyvinyl alcohol dehydrogenase (cytochrome)
MFRSIGRRVGGALAHVEGAPMRRPFRSSILAAAVCAGCVSCAADAATTPNLAGSTTSNSGTAALSPNTSPSGLAGATSTSASNQAVPGAGMGGPGMPTLVPQTGASGGTSAPPEVAPPMQPLGPVEWTTFNYDNNNSRNNRTETKISVANVASLVEKWQRELAGGVSSTPQVVGGKVYVNDHGGSAYRLDGETGAVDWQRRGLYSPRVGTNLVVGDIVFGAGGPNLYAMNTSDGTDAWQARISNHPMPLIDSSPVQAGELIVVGVGSYEIISSSANYTAQGSVVALNKSDGTEVWRWWATKNDAEEGGGVSVWSSIAYDPELKMVWIGTGNPYEAPSPKTSNSLVALEAETGKLVWHSQFHPDDVYTQPGGCSGPGQTTPNCDFDVGASPNLFTAQGKAAVGVGSKGGLYRTFERATGTMLWEKDLGAGTWWGGVMAVAATDDTTIYVANNNWQNGENLFALDMNTGEAKWTIATTSAVWGALTLAHGVLFSCSKDGMMRAYEAATGTELKAWDIGHDAASGVAVSDGVVYATSGFTGQGSVTRPGARVTAFTLP